MKQQNRQDSDKETRELKHRIFAELTKYRKNHGIGCFKAISEASGGKVAVGTIAHMYTGTKVDTAIWILVGEALKRLNEETD
jgi:hypothetical protein